MKTNILKTHFYLITVEGIIGFLWLALIPSESGGSWVFRLSTSRATFLAIIFIFLGISIFFTIKAYRNKNWINKLFHSLDTLFQKDGHRTSGLVIALASVCIGGYVLYESFSTTDLYIRGYFSRIAPAMFWLTAISIQALLYLWNADPETRKKHLQQHGLALLCLLVLIVAGFFMHNYLWKLEPDSWDTYKMFNKDNKFDLMEQDINAIFNEGDRLQKGENPYARALDLGENLKWNQINATYFPVFYILSWLTQEFGLEDYLQWLGFWRVIFLFANLSILYLLFYIPYHRHNNLIFGILAGTFWLFNRWTLHITMIYHIDFIAMFFFLLSLAAWPKYKYLSLLSFGTSLAIKQIAIFMIPIYIIWIWQSVENRSLKQFFTMLMVMAAIPLIFSAPFIVWNAKGFFTSVLISATRISESHFGVPGVDTLLGLSGIPAKLPMLGLMMLTFFMVWKQNTKPFVAAMLIMLIFVDFNSVLFRQYMTWVGPLFPLALSEMLERPLPS